ncbi:MAG: SPOR domain-containing protein [Campylobacterota bacterium]|nr:SPOR domain-containing protein [Campylobacterota bacterium]
MQEKNELNDIILNKGGAASSNKKVILAVATLGVILIIVVMLMNSLTSSGTDNLPQAILPPEPQVKVTQEEIQEPLFEEIEVVEEESSSDADLDLIAQKLKQESFEEELTVETPVVKPKKISKPIKETKQVQKKTSIPKVAVATTGSYYIQVGSFSKYQPNKKFLNSITKLGYSYKYHKVSNLNKVLVGPFKTSNEAKSARRTLRSKVEPGAFLVKL